MCVWEKGRIRYGLMLRHKWLGHFASHVETNIQRGNTLHWNAKEVKADARIARE